jgi:hypothetical protein
MHLGVETGDRLVENTQGTIVEALGTGSFSNDEFQASRHPARLRPAPAATPDEMPCLWAYDHNGSCKSATALPGQWLAYGAGSAEGAPEMPPVRLQSGALGAGALNESQKVTDGEVRKREATTEFCSGLDHQAFAIAPAFEASVPASHALRRPPSNGVSRRHHC